MRGCTRSQDTAARLGGDEFALVVTAESVASLDDVGERIAVVFASPFQVLGRRVGLDVSVGRAVFPLDATDASGLIRVADAAMYSEKGEHHPSPRI